MGDWGSNANSVSEFLICQMGLKILLSRKTVGSVREHNICKWSQQTRVIRYHFSCYYN